MQCPHFCYPPPWLLHLWGFFLDWSLQLKLLCWTTLGACFVLALVKLWTWDHGLQCLTSSRCPWQTRKPFTASLTHIEVRVSDWSTFLKVYYSFFGLPTKHNTTVCFPPLKSSLECHHNMRDVMILSLLTERVQALNYNQWNLLPSQIHAKINFSEYHRRLHFLRLFLIIWLWTVLFSNLTNEQKFIDHQHLVLPSHQSHSPLCPQNESWEPSACSGSSGLIHFFH